MTCLSRRGEERLRRCKAEEAVNTIDIIGAIIAILGFWYGKDKGILGIVFGIMFWTFGIVLAYKMAPVAARILQGVMDSQSPLLLPSAFIVNLIFVWLLLRSAARGSGGILNTFRIGFVNQALGGLLMAYIFLFLYGSFLWFLSETKVLSKAAEEESFAFPYLVEMPTHASKLFKRLKPIAQETWEEGAKWIEKARQYGEEKTKSTEPSTPTTEEQTRIYKIEDDVIRKTPEETKNKEIYEDTGIEY